MRGVRSSCVVTINDFEGYGTIVIVYEVFVTFFRIAHGQEKTLVIDFLLCMLPRDDHGEYEYKKNRVHTYLNTRNYYRTSMNDAVNAVGLISSILISIMFVPQVVHVYKTKDTHAINYTFLNLNMVASSLGLVYSIYYDVIPMIIANTSAGLFSISLIGIKYVNELKAKIHIIEEASMV